MLRAGNADCGAIDDDCFSTLAVNEDTGSNDIIIDKPAAAARRVTNWGPISWLFDVISGRSETVEARASENGIPIDGNLASSATKGSSALISKGTMQKVPQTSELPARTAMLLNEGLDRMAGHWSLKKHFICSDPRGHPIYSVSDDTHGNGITALTEGVRMAKRVENLENLYVKAGKIAKPIGGYGFTDLSEISVLVEEEADRLCSDAMHGVRIEASREYTSTFTTNRFKNSSAPGDASSAKLVDNGSVIDPYGVLDTINARVLERIRNGIENTIRDNNTYIREMLNPDSVTAMRVAGGHHTVSDSPIEPAVLRRRNFARSNDVRGIVLQHDPSTKLLNEIRHGVRDEGRVRHR